MTTSFAASAPRPVLVAALLFSASLLTPGMYGAPIENKIDKVTVYRDRALVTRAGETKLGEGQQEIAFENLPLNLDEASIRARGKGEAVFKILSVEVRRQYEEPPADKGEGEKLRNDLQVLDDSQQKLSDESSDLDERRNMLRDLRTKLTTETVRKTTDNSVSPESLKTAFDFYSTELSKITERKRQIAIESRDLRTKVETMQARASLFQPRAKPEKKQIVVTVEVEKPGTADVEVDYTMSGASWQPQYDARASAATKKIDLTCYGVITQNTGENWDGVNLNLSTARPSSMGRVPELSPWRIDLAKPKVFDTVSSKLDAPAASPAPLMNSYRRDSGLDRAQTSAAPATEAENGVAKVIDLGPSALFAVAGKANIPADGQTHRVTITTLPLTGDWMYEVSPKLITAAFLKARVVNPGPGPLLPGNISVFLENESVGTSYINLVSPSASFDLFLGQDDGIKVVRKEGLSKEDTSGMLTTTRLQQRSFQVEITNFKGTPQKFKVVDQIPVSQNGDLKVNVTTLTPADAKRDPQTGLLTWELTLAPQEKKAIDVQYQVESAPGKEVAGM